MNNAHGMNCPIGETGGASISDRRNAALTEQDSEKTTDCASTYTSTKRNKGGAPKHNANALAHGGYALLNLRRRKGSRPPQNTALGRAFTEREREYIADLGEEENVSLAQRQLVNDSTWCDFILAVLDFDISKKRQLIRKGKPHAVISLRLQIAGHRRENFKLLGLKRVTRERSLNEVLAHDDSATAANENSPRTNERNGQMPTQPRDAAGRLLPKSGNDSA